MKKVIRNNITNLPYSLHDGVVIAFEVLEDNLIMKFQSGFIKTTEPYGYNTSKFDGYLSNGDSFQECKIEIYHLGNMSYLVEE